MNANDAQLTELTTAQSGSTVEDNAPNAPGQPAFNVVVEAVAGSAVGGSGAPYTLTVTAMDLTNVAAAPALKPTITNPQHFDLATGWKPSGPDFEYSQIMENPQWPLRHHTALFCAMASFSHNGVSSATK